jgi:mRNA interferase MazF
MRRGEIWLVDFNPSKGAEISKVRPALIISNNDAGILPLRVVAPITDWKERYSSINWIVELVPNEQNGLSKPSGVDCFQCRSISTERVIKKLGKLSNFEMSEVEFSLFFVFDIK